MSEYDYGLDVLGAEPVYYGPVSPEQLSKLYDRPLTAAEYAAVSAYESKKTDEDLAKERAKGGPRSEEVAVTSKGAIIRKVEPTQWPWLKIAQVVGLIAVGVGFYYLLDNATARPHRAPQPGVV